MRSARVAASVVLVVLSGAASAQERNLTELDLDTLMKMDVRVTSAAKREQRGGDAAAAVFVITREDIRRIGATSIPELLRSVPGLHVARIANSRWAVTSRGFNGQFANKLLVLVDGRSIYTPLFSGVAWEDQQVPVEEVERIEVVRGPGGALWGANAVNGVINIITRSASAQQGLSMNVSAGDEESRAVAVRFGERIDATSNFRLYAENFERDSFEVGAGSWQRTQAGGRWDRALREGSVSLLGDVYDSRIEDYVRNPAGESDIRDEGGNLNARLDGRPVAGGTIDLRASMSWRSRIRFNADAERESVYSLDAQYSHERAGRHLWTLGANARYDHDHMLGQPGVLTFDPERSSQKLWGIYAQDEIFFLNDTLSVTASAKLEDPGATRSALQPTLRVLWHANSQHILWAAVSRAVRSPSRFERNTNILFAFMPGDPPVASRLLGDPSLKDETMHSGELGWRWRPLERLGFDIALFEHRYENLVVVRSGAPVLDAGPPETIFVDARYANELSARTRGVGASMDWIAMPTLRFQGSIATLQLRQSAATGLLNTFLGVDPEHSFSLRAQLDLPRNMHLDISWRNVGKLPDYGIDGYDSVDAQLGWHVSPRFEVLARIDNVFDKRHIEYFDEENQRLGDVLGRTFFVRANLRLSPWHDR